MLALFGHEQYTSEIRSSGRMLLPPPQARQKLCPWFRRPLSPFTPVGPETSMDKYTQGVWREGEVEAPGSDPSLVPTALTKC